MKNYFHFLFISIFFIANLSGQVYVKHDAVGANNGNSWTNAYTDLQTAIDSNALDQEIWVAAGTYYPQSDNLGNYLPVDLRKRSFHPKIGTASILKLYGGFFGNETLLSQRNPDLNVTTLSGDLGISDDYSDNAYHVFTINTAGVISTVIDGFVLSKGRADGLGSFEGIGGAIFARNSILEISNCVFHDNQSSSFGGAIYVYLCSFNMIISQFYDNQSSNGGAVYLGSNENGSSIEGCSFIDNTALQSGGSIYNNCDSIVILETAFMSNFANNSGGAIHSFSAKGVQFDSLILENNIATNNGGGINLNNGDGSFTRIHSQGNKAQWGGGIRVSLASVSLTDSYFIADSASIGGAINISNGQASIDHVQFSLNKAFNGVAFNGDNINVTLNHCIFNENTRPDPITYGSLINLSNSSLTGNNCKAFDNLRLSAISSQNSRLAINNSNIHNNYGLGHKLFDLLNTHVFFKNVFITDNQFSTNFSVFGSNTVDTVELINTHILRNEGDIFNLYSVNEFKLVNSVISNNFGPLFSNLFNLSSTKAALLNSIVVGNVDYIGIDSLIRMFDSELTINNCIITDNAHKGITGNNNTLNASHSIIQNGTSLGPNILDVDPMFVDPSSDDFNLQMGSPAINTGSPLLAPNEDILGNPRPQGGFYDMGIYEYTLPTQFVFHGAFDDDWFNGANWDTGFPPPNVFNGNIIFNASAVKLDGLGFDIHNPGTMNFSNGVVVEIK